MNRHQRRMQAALDRRVGQPIIVDKPAGRDVLCVVVSYKGVDGATSENIEAMKDAMLTAGHGFAHKTIRRTPLDLARNESWTLIRASTAQVGLFMDDDCQVDAGWLPRVVDLLDSLGVITAPVRLRGSEEVFNVSPIGPPQEILGERVMEVNWTGFGAVLVSRQVVEQMHVEYESLHYASAKYPGMTSCALFRSEIVPNKVLAAQGPPDERRYILDDRVWSLRAQALGIKIWATIDVDTAHDGLVGNFGKLFDRCVLCAGCAKDVPAEEGAPEVTELVAGPYACARCGSDKDLRNFHRPVTEAS